MNNDVTGEPNKLLVDLIESRQKFEAEMRVPQLPAEHERTVRLLSAINSAIEIVKNTNMTELTQQS